MASGRHEGNGLAGQYRPLEDYALLGDSHGAALVSRSGSVDWCCLGRFDAEPTFCRLLDAGKGGYLSVRPNGDFEVERSYLGRTNILETIFTTPEGRVSLLDFMPAGRRPGSGVHDYVSQNAPHWFVRVVEALEGCVSLAVELRPAPDFARRAPDLAGKENASRSPAVSASTAGFLSPSPMEAPGARQGSRPARRTCAW